MSLTATLLFNQPFILPNGQWRRNDMDKPKRRDQGSRSEYRKRQAARRAANLTRLVDAIASGASTMQAAALTTGLSISMVKKALPVLEEAGRIVRINGRSIPHLYRVAR